MAILSLEISLQEIKYLGNVLDQNTYDKNPGNQFVNFSQMTL